MVMSRREARSNNLFSSVGKLPLDRLVENWKHNPWGELILNAGLWELCFAHELWEG